jgi:single-strand DNA-binding protein
MAINRRWRDRQSGENREEVTFVDVEVWSKTAELAGQYLTKGRAVFVEGRLKLDQWDDRNTGQKRSRLKVVGENIQFLGGRGEGAGTGPGAAPTAAAQGRPAPARRGADGAAAATAPEAAPEPGPEAEIDETFEASEDIPF